MVMTDYERQIRMQLKAICNREGAGRQSEDIQSLAYLLDVIDDLRDELRDRDELFTKNKRKDVEKGVKKSVRIDWYPGQPKRNALD